MSKLMKVRSIQDHNYGAESLIDPKNFDKTTMVKEEDFKEKKAAPKKEEVEVKEPVKSSSKKKK